MSQLKIAWKLFLTYVVIIIICTGIDRQSKFLGDEISARTIMPVG